MTEYPRKYQLYSDSFSCGITSSQKSLKLKKSPNCPLTKGPFIRIKVECKNLDLLIKSTSINEIYFNNTLGNYYNNTYSYSSNKNINSSTTNSLKKPFINNKPEFNIYPFIKIHLNNQQYNLESINHNNPKWLNYYELEIKNYKIDKIFLEVFNLVKSEKKVLLKVIESEKNDYSEEFMGFQVLPIKFLEKSNLSGKENSIVLRLIDKHPNEYFVHEDGHVLNLDNHDPANYKLDEPSENETNDSKNFF